MESFINNGYSGKKLAAIKECQLFLQVIHLLDARKGDGVRICDNVYRVHKHECVGSTYEWPIQGTPGKSDWLEWRKAIESTFLIPAWSYTSTILPFKKLDDER